MKSETWQKLFEDSHHLTKPARAVQLISEEDSAEIHLLIKGIIQKFLDKGNLHIGLKTYVNHELRNDMVEQMLLNPPANYTSLESWSQQIFKEEKFGMIFNCLEEYSNEFAEKAASIVNPLLRLAGLPLGGLSFLFFMGNYGFTPFGVHKEAVGEDGILFHLGPAKKQFYTWDDPKYNTIEHNTKVFHDFDKMLPAAKCYELNPGDAMFIPHQVYHIANTSEFSLSFVMDYINPPTDDFQNQLINLAGKEELVHDGTYHKPLRLESSVSEWNEVLEQQSIQRRIEAALHRKILSLKSNAGILRKSNTQAGSPFPNGYFSIKAKVIFPIFLDEQTNGNTAIFARGHRISSKYHPVLRRLIDRLNNGESILNDTFQEALEPEWDLIDIFGFIGNLLQVEAVTIESIINDSLG